MNAVVAELVTLLEAHDQEEKRLIALIRAEGGLPMDATAVHDAMERTLLYKFAAASDAEGREAIDRYDRTAEEARWVSADSL